MVERLRSFPWRPVPYALFCGAVLAIIATQCHLGVERDVALRQALGDQGLSVSAIAWVDAPPEGILQALSGCKRALVRAARRGEPSDIYLVRAKLSPDGNLLRVTQVSNLTQTPDADEGAPVVDGELAVYTAAIEGVTTSLFALHLSRAKIPEGDDITSVMRAQIALTNLQQTGQLAGMVRRGWSFDPSPFLVHVELRPDSIEVDADGHLIRLPREGEEPLEGRDLVRPHRSALSRPGNLVAWAVDRVRALSWFGDDRMQSLKAFAFTVIDFASRLERSFLGDPTAKEIASDMGGGREAAPAAYTDPDTGWPPPPMDPILTPSLAGEGAWTPLDHDPFVLTNPGAPAAFMTSFIRTDRERPYTRVYVALWDPRQVEMHMMAGTVEPVGASGEAGPGLIPRTPEVIGRVVAAMNGGFQAMHGEFGMMGDGIVYLPPKPYAATVAALRDGSTGFGEWPADEGVPDSILSFRQNLTVLVKDEKFNPYGRTWWGGTPPGQTDKIHTVRTGICLTRENFIAYFYGAETAADVLAQGMIRARCKFGMHLDMNAGHSGLEFYRAAPAAELPSIGRALQSDWEATGPVPGLDGWSFLGRRLIRRMGLMNFPRYIHREARDFFYLTLRHVLPGADVASSSADEGHWRTHGLPQHGFPFALASTVIHPDPARPDFRVDLLKIDPRVVAAKGALGSDAAAPTVVVFNDITRAGAPHPTLWLASGAFSIAPEPPEGATELFSGVAISDAASASATASVGIADYDGMLIYAEASGSADPATDLDRVLERLGCSSRMTLPHSLSPALGGTTTLGDTPATPKQGSTMRLLRRQAPGATSIFEDTPIVPPEVWQPLQMRRVRYFKKPTPPAPAPPSAPPATPSNPYDPFDPN